ncbi:MAG: lipocalin family protein [Clostridia bacterium]|nr:lipocalin family protein [Clostridia bacterium]
MKKTLFITTAIVLVIASCICLMACGNDSDDGVIDKDLVGHYGVESITINGEAGYMPKDMYTIDLKDDGTFSYNCDPENLGTPTISMTGEWRYKDNKVTLKFKDSQLASMELKYENNRILIENDYGTEHAVITLVRE